MNKGKSNELQTDNTVAQLVDYETGEIMDSVGYGDKVKITRKEDKDKKREFLDAYEVGFNKDISFVKLYKGVNELRKHLTTGEFTIAISLCDYVCYEDCIVRRGGTHKGKILTIKELAEDMEIEYDSLRRTISSLVKKGVLGIHKTGCKDKPDILIKSITVNPNIYSRGNKVSKTAIGLFENSNWNLRDKQNKS